MGIHLQQGTDARRYNLPTVEEEIAAIVPGEANSNVGVNHNIIVCLQDGGLHHISNHHSSYLPLHYVLLFSKDEAGWHLDISLQQQNDCQHRSKKVTQILWHVYRLHVRPENVEPSNLFKGGRLFQQLACDAWASIDQCNLTWIANNQTRLRADLYQGLHDCLGQDGVQDIGQVGHIILPSTHKGGTRHMQQPLQDSLAIICREYRKPDLFLTMTANVTWP